MSREFRYVEDALNEIVRGVERIISPMPINLGTRNEIRITHTSPTDREVMWVPEPNQLGLNFSAGQSSCCVDTSRAKCLLGWELTVALEDGLCDTIR